ncbi:hsp70 nucleotide exchange factor FES1-like [Lolium rigidum]|uniref:hsp70 nucleotide exchange factor FES1-like n=1 Tax=Lolium rigidum TaxID=89674 RepID=UPI001F5D6689|nr:hsp70 nucleotide exchange factor FES1-like [Lolium rigidum]
MAGDHRMSWARLLKWSLSYIDGARPSRAISEEERRWLAEAAGRHMAEDVVSRLREIALLMSTPLSVLEAQGITPDDIEDLLAELQVHVESIDVANDLHSVGGLVPVIRYLRNSNARIRAKAADVVTTVVQNNPTSQQLVMEASGFEPLVSNFTSDPDLTARIKALGALSSLIRNNKPGVAAFRLANGYAGLRDALNSESARFQRKALSLTHYLLSENHSDCSVFAQLGFPHLMMHLVSSNDSGVREAALGGLPELARDTALGNRTLLADQDRLQRLLWGRIQSIRMMAPDDLDAAREERQLVDSLWVTCYHQPSMLQREGLLVLPGEESFEQPPDVAGRFFEPLRQGSLRRAAPDERSDTGNGTGGGMMLLLGPAPGNSQGN